MTKTRGDDDYNDDGACDGDDDDSDDDDSDDDDDDAGDNYGTNDEAKELRRYIMAGRGGGPRDPHPKKQPTQPGPINGGFPGGSNEATGGEAQRGGRAPAVAGGHPQRNNKAKERDPPRWLRAGGDED